MYSFGAKWTGTDISPEQIEQAKKLSQGMGIGYYAMPAEKIDFPDASFDAATACQCFWYFDHEKLIPPALPYAKKQRASSCTAHGVAAV